jgi:SsrA-binding protein
MASPFLEPVVLRSFVELVAKLTASSSATVEATASKIGTPLPEVQPKKAAVLWLGGGPFTNANEQPPNAVESAASASGARTLRREIEGEVTEEWPANAVPRVADRHLACGIVVFDAMAKAAPTEAMKVLARNKKARHEYHVDETIEAGIVLVGSEVKSIRAGKVTLVDAFADIDRGEAWLHQMDIGVYTFAHQRNHDPRRKRKLLLHRREIDRLAGKIREKGSTLVPLSLYEKKGCVKAELALVHGKQSWDKREDSKKRESQREIDRAMASRRR